MIDISKLKFDKNGLIPAVVVDAVSGTVLMLAYMNEESLEISINEKKTCFWSRSRQELWRKGETSGNVQYIIGIKTDCDKDALLITVKKNGPACHTGADSCFFDDLYDAQAHRTEPFSLDTLNSIIAERKQSRKPGSYTTYLFEKGLDKILKKFGEESTETIIAAKSGIKEDTVYELADLVYHTMVLMAEMEITPDEIKNELASRHSGKEVKK